MNIHTPQKYPSRYQSKPLTKPSRKIPRVVAVTCTLTATEFTRLAEECEQHGISLSELGRERIMAPIPFETWGAHAVKALANKEQDLLKQKLLRSKHRKENRRLMAYARKKAAQQNPDGGETPLTEKEIYKNLKEKEENQNNTRVLEKRVAQLQIRLTAYESVKIRWSAYCLKMSLASFIRKMVLGYLPGGEDDSTLPWISYSKTKAGKEEMLQAVINISQEGRIPPCTSLFYCKSCAQVLSAEDKQ